MGRIKRWKGPRVKTYELKIRFVDYWLFRRTSELLQECNMQKCEPREEGPISKRTELYVEKKYEFCSESDERAKESVQQLKSEMMDGSDDGRRYVVRSMDLWRKAEDPVTGKLRPVAPVWDWSDIQPVSVSPEVMASYGLVPLQ